MSVIGPITLKENKISLKKLFKKCFPTDNYLNSFPYDNDDLFLIVHPDRKTEAIGMCIVHDKPPYKYDVDGVYMYNLCVHPKHRKKGYATMLVNAVKEIYSIIHLHHLVNNKNGHEWFIKRGFYPKNIWRVIYKEYTYSAIENTPKTVEYKTEIVSPLYDPIQNFFYMS